MKLHKKMEWTLTNSCSYFKSDMAETGSHTVYVTYSTTHVLGKVEAVGKIGEFKARTKLVKW